MVWDLSHRPHLAINTGPHQVVDEAGILTLPSLVAYLTKVDHAPLDLQALANAAGTYFEDRFREQTGEKHGLDAFNVLQDCLENWASFSDLFYRLAKWHAALGECRPAKQILQC